MKHVYIAGLCHRLQKSEPTGNVGRRLSKLIEALGIDLVGEEAQHESDLTVARAVAESLKKRWVPIDMTDEQRAAAGLRIRRTVLIPIYPDNLLVEVYLPYEDGIREDHMIDQVNRHLREEQVCLVVCGLFHVAPLARKFQGRGIEVRHAMNLHEP